MGLRPRAREARAWSSAITVGRTQSSISTRQCLRDYIFFFLTVNLMFLSWNWQKVFSKMIVKSKFRCRKTIHLPKNFIERKQVCKEWSHAIARTAGGDDNNNNNTHLFSVNKFKRFLFNFLIKHMVNASLSIAELWMHSGDSGLLSSQQLEELRIVYWRHQRAQ